MKKLELRLIDASGPFFIDYDKQVINWSKIPFENLEKNNRLDRKKCNKVLEKMDKYLTRISKLGFNAISLDDLAHMVTLDEYPEYLKQKLKDYQWLYKKIFELTNKYKLKVYVLTDFMFFNQTIKKVTKNSYHKTLKIFSQILSIAFKENPINGIIIRIGESDGVDVRGDFLSQLTAKTNKQCNRMLKEVTKVCQKYKKQCVFRTWTLGAFQNGDLIWNQKTLKQILLGLPKNNLVISFKYGESDFFRYLEINPLIKSIKYKKIIELQCRREYEGMGSFPSFVGWDYSKYIKEAKLSDNLIGTYVWGQTGGWSRFNNLTFLDKSSIWNELNVFVCSRFNLGQMDVIKIVSEFCKIKKIKQVDKFLKILRLSEKIIKKGWYIKEFAKKKKYFRRIRIPPNLWIFWDNIIINKLIVRIYSYEVENKREAIRDGYRTINKSKEMERIAKEMGLETEGFEMLTATLKIMAELRKLLLDSKKIDPEILMKQIDSYHQKYINGYRFNVGIDIFIKKKYLNKLTFKFLFRRRTNYRLIEKILLNRYISRLNLWLVKRYFKKDSTFLDRMSMPIETFFR